MVEGVVERKMVHPLLEVIAGSMFSGKTDELIRRLEREEKAKLNVQLFKPSIDIRYDPKKVNSHSGRSRDAILVGKDDPKSILKLVDPAIKVIGIDEVQFFSDEIVDVCEELVAMGKRVIVDGLPTDFRGEPFGAMPFLMAIAEKVDKLAAICMVCGEEAYFTQRIKIVNGERLPVNYDDPLILVGAEQDYEARCRVHHEVPGRPDSKQHGN
jgi:thymidine kinase